VTQQLEIVLVLERADRVICHLGLSSTIILTEGLRFCLSSHACPERSCADFQAGYLQRATLADSFLPVCPRIQSQEIEINPNLICSLYMSLRIVAHCLRPLKRRCLYTLMFMASIIGVLCIVQLLSIAHKLNSPSL
jgi:hypothetical protein